jgi:hypothetical protein
MSESILGIMVVDLNDLHRQCNSDGAVSVFRCRVTGLQGLFGGACPHSPRASHAKLAGCHPLIPPPEQWTAHIISGPFPCVAVNGLVVVVGYSTWAIHAVSGKQLPRQGANGRTLSPLLHSVQPTLFYILE